MKGNLLVIDEGRGGGAVLALLERGGYRCFGARGPIKVRALLEAESIDLIVWREHGAEPELTGDLAAEWGRHPQIPVLHLYPGASAAPSKPPEPAPRESLPADSVESTLLNTVERMLGAAREAAQASTLQHTELAFRQVVSRLRATWKRNPAKEQAAAETFRSSSTAVEPMERELIFSSPTPPRPSERAIAIFSLPFRRFINFLTMQRP